MKVRKINWKPLQCAYPPYCSPDIYVTDEENLFKMDKLLKLVIIFLCGLLY